MLQLSPSKRRYFESLNISPIDLEPLVHDIADIDTKHKHALQLFFNALGEEEPDRVWEWQTSAQKLYKQRHRAIKKGKSTDSPNYEHLPIEQVIRLLKQDRETYPGWFVAPVDTAQELAQSVDHLHRDTKVLEDLAPKTKAELLYEVMWRYQQTQAPAGDFLVKAFHEVLQPEFESHLSEKQRREIALRLVKNQYWDDGKDNALNAIYSHARQQLEAFTHLFPETELELLYLDAIVARDEFDYEKLQTLLASMEKSYFSAKPVWVMRRAALHAELGDFKLSKQLVNSAFNELDRKIKQQPDSMYLLSLWSWCGFLNWAYSEHEERKSIPREDPSVKEAKCDYKTHFDEADYRLVKLEKDYIKTNVSPIEPEFKSGESKDHRDAIRSRSINQTALIFIHSYAEYIGLPMFGSMTSILNQKTAKACIYAENLENLRAEKYFVLALRAAHGGNSDLVEKQFSRLAVARAPMEIVKRLFPKLITLLDYWLSKFVIESKPQDNCETCSMIASRVAVVMEILARIAVRLNEQQSLDLYSRALELAEQPAINVGAINAQTMNQYFNNLIEYSLQSIPKHRLKSVVLPSLRFPLAEAKKSHWDWPNPVIENVRDIEITPEITSEWRRLINRLDETSKNRNTAILLRLLPFCEADLLDKETETALANKLWDTSADIKVAIESYLLANALLSLACPDQEQYRRKIVSHLFSLENLTLETGKIPRFNCISIYARDRYHAILPTSEQAEVLFLKMVEWLPEQQEDIRSGLLMEPRKALETLANQMALAMSFSFVPCLPQIAFTEQNYELLIALKTRLKQQNLAHTALLPALVEFAVRLSVYRDHVAKEIKYAMAIEREGFANATEAILHWIDKSISKKLLPKVSELRDLLVAGVSPVSNTTNLKYALWGCVQLDEKDNLSSQNMEYLVDVLPVLFDAYDYQNFNPYTQATSRCLLQSYHSACRTRHTCEGM